MARPRKLATLDPLGDLNKKSAILEREMSAQRDAMARLKEMAGTRAHPSGVPLGDKTGRPKRVFTSPR